MIHDCVKKQSTNLRNQLWTAQSPPSQSTSVICSFNHLYARKIRPLFLALALLTTTLIPIQAATNTVFSKAIGCPQVAGLMVFVVGLTGMTGYLLLSRTPVAPLKQMKAASLYSYLGGLIVVIY